MPSPTPSRRRSSNGPRAACARAPRRGSRPSRGASGSTRRAAAGAPRPPPAAYASWPSGGRIRAARRAARPDACAHPAIEPGIRSPLILQTVLGFDAAAIGSAFLVSPTAMAQRLVRAKRKIREAGIPFQVPERLELAPRLAGVLDAIYAAFAEGWSDLAGADARSRNLAEEAIWLGELVATLLPTEAEALGLLSLILYHRRAATRGAMRAASTSPSRSRTPRLGTPRRSRRPSACSREPARCRARAASSSRRPSNRPTSPGACPVARTGRRSCASTTSSSPPPPRRWSR